MKLGENSSIHTEERRERMKNKCHYIVLFIFLMDCGTDIAIEDVDPFSRDYVNQYIDQCLEHNYDYKIYRFHSYYDNDYYKVKCVGR